MGGREHEYNREQQSQDAENKPQSGELAKGEEQASNLAEGTKQRVRFGHAEKETGQPEKSHLMFRDTSSLVIEPAGLKPATPSDVRQSIIDQIQHRLELPTEYRNAFILQIVYLLTSENLELLRNLKVDEEELLEAIEHPEAPVDKHKQLAYPKTPNPEIEEVKKQWQDEGTIDVEVPQDGRKETITYKVPSRRDKHEIKPSSFLEVMTGFVVYQAKDKLREQEAERRREQNKQAQKRYEQKQREEDLDEVRRKDRERKRRQRAKQRLQQRPTTEDLPKA